jgi:predicted transcriptional regulator
MKGMNLMTKRGEISETGKGKGISTSPEGEADFTQITVQEKLKFDPQRDILKGGSDEGSSSNQQEALRLEQERIKEVTKAWNTKESYREYIDEMYAEGMINTKQHTEAQEYTTKRYDKAIEAIEKMQKNSASLF